MSSTQMNAPWTATQAQAYELAEKLSIIQTQNNNAMGSYINNVMAAVQNGQSITSVPDAIVLGLVPNTDPSVGDFYAVEQTGAFTMPPPVPVAVSANPVGPLNPQTTVYNAVLPAAANYRTGDTYTDPDRGTFVLTAINSPFGVSRWWTPVPTPAAS